MTDAGEGPSRVVAVANVLGAAGAVASAVLVLVTSLAALEPCVWRYGYEHAVVVPWGAAITTFPLALLWVVVARRGARLPTLSLTRWAVLGPGIVAAALVASAGVAWGLLGLLGATLPLALLTIPAHYLLDRFLGAALDEAAFAASRSRAASDVAEARLAVASLAIGAMPLAFLPFVGPVGRARGAGLWVAAASCVVPAVVALVGTRFRVRFPPKPDTGSPERRAWAQKRALGSDLRAPFRPARPRAGAAWASALLVGATAWRFPLVLTSREGIASWIPPTLWLLVSLACGALALALAIHPRASRRSGAIPWVVLAAGMGASTAVRGFEEWGARVALVCLGLALVPAWVARTTTGKGSLDAVDTQHLATAATGVVSGAAFLAWCILGLRVAAAGAVAAGAVAAFVAARAWVRLDARRLVGEVALQGRTEGVRATLEGDVAVVSFDRDAPGYREGGVDEHLVLVVRPAERP